MSAEKRRRLQGLVAMPDKNGHTPRLTELLIQIVRELSDCKVDLLFAHERLPTHSLLIKNLYRLVAGSDFVLCFTDGQDPDIAFEAGLASGLQKPFVLVILPETQRLLATFMGHLYVELPGDSEDREHLRSVLANLGAGLSRRNGASVGPPLLAGLPRLGCAGAEAMIDRTGSWN
jgi:hypothetical protein